MKRSIPILWQTALLSVLLTIALTTPAQAQQLITNGGFESGFTDWTTADQLGSDGTFFVQSGTESPVNAFPVLAPPEGVQAAMTDAQAGGSHILYQDFTVPVDVVSGSISFALYINNGADFFSPTTLDWATAVLNQQVRVDILTTAADPFSVEAADILQNLYQSNPGDPAVSGYTTITTDISALLQGLQGQTVRLRFVEVDNVSFLNLGVDQVSLVASNQVAAAPEPSSCLLLLTAGSGLMGLVRLARNWRRNSL